MKIEKRKVSDLVPNPQNVRKHNTVQIQEFKKSIDKFGVIRPIVIDEDNMILAGHGLLEALKLSNAKECDVIVMKGLSDTDKKKLLLADNKIYSLGFDDYSVIEEILSELGQASDFEVPGYDSNVLEELYGIKSVEEEVEKSGTPVSKALSDLSTTSSAEMPVEVTEGEEEPVPSKRVEEARKEAENRPSVICPNCGERIWL